MTKYTRSWTFRFDSTSSYRHNEAASDHAPRIIVTSTPVRSPRQPNDRLAKIACLREAIAAGSYHVSAAQLADSMQAAAARDSRSR